VIEGESMCVVVMAFGDVVSDLLGVVRVVSKTVKASDNNNTRQ
jgi:hypothetical protein